MVAGSIFLFIYKIEHMKLSLLKERWNKKYFVNYIISLFTKLENIYIS